MTRPAYLRPPLERDVVREPHAIVFRLDVRTPNPLNGGQGRHWAATARMRKAQRQLAMYATTSFVRHPMFPLTVTIARLSAGRLDVDGLLAALKSIRDGIADGLGLRDDSDPRVTWGYAQGKAPRGKYGVEIRVEEGGGCDAAKDG